MVFSSKSRSPYTQMYLTHLDEEGNDSPAILIENATAANRAVNLPEFVNIAADGLLKIEVPAAEFYRLFDRAWQLAEKGQYEAAIAEWKKALELSPEDAKAHNNLGRALAGKGDFEEAIGHWRKALEVNPKYAEARNNLGTVYYAKRSFRRAIREYNRALKVAPKSATILSNLGTAYFARKKYKQASQAYQEALALDPEVFEHRSTQGTLLQERTIEERAKFHYYLAKTYAQAGMTDRALEYIRKSLEEGFKDRKKYIEEPEFAGLQKLPEFQDLMAREFRVL